MFGWLTRWTDRRESPKGLPPERRTHGRGTQLGRARANTVTYGGEERRRDASGEPDPWLVGGVPRSPDPRAVRTDLTKVLYEELDKTRRQPDQVFLQSLLRTVGMEDLEFPPFPKIAHQLDVELSRVDPNMAKLVRLVEQDPDLVRRVWNQANSVHFTEPPSNLHQAITRIGFDSLWRIGMHVCVKTAVFKVRGYQEQANIVRAHGYVVAELSAWLGGDQRGETFLAGLLHDVGKLVVYRAAGQPAAEGPADASLVRRVAAELHPGLGLLVMHAWKLSDGVANAVGFHHAPEESPEETRDLVRLLWSADVAAHTAYSARMNRASGGLAVLGSMKYLGMEPEVVLEQADALWTSALSETVD